MTNENSKEQNFQIFIAKLSLMCRYNYTTVITKANSFYYTPVELIQVN